MSMLNYALRRLLYMMFLMVLLSIVIFIIIQLPPGDYASAYIAELKAQGGEATKEHIAAVRKRFGLDLPLYRQYLKWVSGLIRGDLGRSFAWNKPISILLMERLPLTIAISVGTLIFTYIIGIPIGIYSATHQYSILDYIFTVIGFVGVGMPNFLLALILLIIFNEYFGISAVGIQSSEFRDAAWSWAKFVDMIRHFPIPLIIIGTSRTCGLIRVMRGTLLDELRAPYVITGRAKGLSETKLLFKYPIRIAVNPILSTIGWTLPAIFSGSAITSIVLLLPTVGPLLLESLMRQDFYVAGSIVMILALLTLIGTFISDILIALADPRIRYD